MCIKNAAEPVDNVRGVFPLVKGCLLSDTVVDVGEVRLLTCPRSFLRGYPCKFAHPPSPRKKLAFFRHV